MKVKSLLGICIAVLLIPTSITGCAEKKFSYSDGIDKNGFYEKINALDYVEVGDYKGISIPKEAYVASDEAIQKQIQAIMANFMKDGVTPELTDEFVAEYLFLDYGYRTIGDMKAGIRSSIESSALFDYMRKYLVENIPVTSVPDSLVEYQKNTLIKAYQDSADFYKMELDDFIRVYVRVSSIERLIEKNLEDINNNAKFSLVIQGIAEDAGISATDDVVNAYVKKHLEEQNYTEYVDTYGLPYLRYITLQQAVMDYLVDHADLA